MASGVPSPTAVDLQFDLEQSHSVCSLLNIYTFVCLTGVLVTGFIPIYLIGILFTGFLDPLCRLINYFLEL